MGAECTLSSALVVLHWRLEGGRHDVARSGPELSPAAAVAGGGDRHLLLPPSLLRPELVTGGPEARQLSVSWLSSLLQARPGRLMESPTTSNPSSLLGAPAAEHLLGKGLSEFILK